MGYNKKVLQRLGFFLLLLHLLASPVFSQNTPRVLFVHSYHRGFSWTQDIETGFIETLGKSNFYPRDFRSEYLDTKRLHSTEYFSQVIPYLNMKYKGYHPDLIVTSDNDAFDLLRKNRGVFFPESLLVFTGVNNFRPQDLTALQPVVGVAEEVDYLSTFQTARRLFPERKKYFLLADGTTSGRAILADFYKAVPPSEGDFLDAGSLSMEDLLEALRQVESQAVVILLAFVQDQEGRDFSPEEVSKRLSQEVFVPLFANHDVYFTPGVLGGMITRGRDQGNLAGELAVRYLGGEGPESIGVRSEKPLSLIFDWSQLQRFQIPDLMLPAGAEVIRKPLTLYDTNPFLAWFLTGLFLLALVIILLSAFYIAQLKKTQRSLRETQKRLSMKAEELEKRNGEIQHFVYAISHDLKGPLITVKAYSGQLKRAFELHNQDLFESDRTRIEGAADRLIELLESIRKISELGLKPMTLEPLDLGEVFTAVVHHLPSQLQKDLNYSQTGPLPGIRGDRGLITALFQNLVENSLKFRSPLRPLEISLGYNSQKDQYEYRDNGLGFPPHFAEKIFGLFEKLNPQTPGTGFGLTLVRKVMELHGGTVSAASPGPDQGAEFRLTFSQGGER